MYNATHDPGHQVLPYNGLIVQRHIQTPDWLLQYKRQGQHKLQHETVMMHGKLGHVMGLGNTDREKNSMQLDVM